MEDKLNSEQLVGIFICSWVASSIIFYFIATWYVYDYKKLKEENEFYSARDFIAWIAPIWPFVIFSLLITKCKKE